MNIGEEICGEWLRHVKGCEIVQAIRSEYGLDVQPVINETVQDALEELRVIARRETKELTSSVMRYLQIEERLRRHVDRLTRE